MYGAKTPGSGRRIGTPNKSTSELRAMAQEYGPAAIAFYVSVLNDQTRMVETRMLAAKELLDRGYGKASQAISVQVQAPPVPPYFDWLPPERLAQMNRWIAEARAAMERGEPSVSDADHLLPEAWDVEDAVVVDAEPHLD
jgi:hypothetical protein